MSGQTADEKREMKHPEAPDADNPFRSMYINERIGYSVHQSVKSRLQCVKNFSLAECHAALEIKDLQVTVEKAIKRRIRKLEEV